MVNCNEITIQSTVILGFSGVTSFKEPAGQCRRLKRHRIDPWVGKIPWRRPWQPLQYSCLENPMERGAWWATVHRVAKSRTQLKQLSMHFFFLFFFKFKFIYFNWRLITLQYCIGSATHQQQGFPDGSDGKASACNAGDPGGSIPGLGRYPGERNGNPLQYSCLGNPMDGGAWQATVHGATLSWIWLSDFSFSFLFLHNCNLEMI